MALRKTCRCSFMRQAEVPSSILFPPFAIRSMSCTTVHRSVCECPCSRM